MSIKRLQFLLILFSTLTVSAQQLRKMSIESFEQDPLDLAAQSDQYKRIDDSNLYSIIKVKSTQSDDNLEDYIFDFGSAGSIPVNHPETEELWVYVQKGAKTVTVTRKGYEPIQKYDLGVTIGAGCTYLMWISSATHLPNTQIVMFHVKPAKARPTIKVKADRENAVEMSLGTTDGMGTLAKNLPFGTYTYWVTSENYHPSEGQFTLNDQERNHIETLTLRGNYGTITLTVDSEAEIFIDGVNMGFQTWTGDLKVGEHQVECRQMNHHPSTQTITVMENETRTISLTPPTPISEQTVTLCPDSNHPHKIDMGDGIKWACCNVGAKSPTENGNYFAWGETMTKGYFNWDTYKWGNGTRSRLTKYCMRSSEGQMDNKNQLEPADDTATTVWGENWRMPTKQELVDLTMNYEWTKATVNGVKGVIVTADNGNSIFFPFNGYNPDSKIFGAGTFGYYWSSTIGNHPTVGSSFACVLSLVAYSESICNINEMLRFYGPGIRPVTDK